MVLTTPEETSDDLSCTQNSCIIFRQSLDGCQALSAGCSFYSLVFCVCLLKRDSKLCNCDGETQSNLQTSTSDAQT
jgi:hypothetical protein